MRPEPTRRRSNRGGRGSGFDVKSSATCSYDIIIVLYLYAGNTKDLESRPAVVGVLSF